MLDEIFTAYKNTTSENFYSFVARLKSFLEKKPLLRKQENHPLFISVIEQHISMLERERDLIKKFLSDREDTYMDMGLYHMPNVAVSDYQHFSKKCYERIEELEEDIREYSADLVRRKSL